METEKPSPGDDEILVRIHATAVTASDIFIRGLKVRMQMRIFLRLMMGLVKPRNPVIGLVLAGEIESVGKYIERFHPGDKGTHMFRKTLGRHVWESNDHSEKSLILLGNLFNHSSVKITKAYLGIREKEISDVYLSL